MTDPALTQDWPVHRDVPADASERALRELYAHRPGEVRLGLIRSHDGYLTGRDGSSRSLSGPADLRVLRALRSTCDVVLVGASTVRTENYRDIHLSRALSQARLRDGLAAHPALVVMTVSGDVPGDVTPQHSWVAAPDESRMPSRWQGRVLPAHSPEELLAALARHGMTRVLCEGGAHVAQWWHDAGLVDDWCLTTSPHAGGPGAPSAPTVPADATLQHRLTADAMIIERWSRPHAATDA